MSPLVVVVLMLGVLALNFVLWRRRGRGWRPHVDAFIAVLQPYVPEPVTDVVVLQPAGTVGRQARAEQGRGLRTLAGGIGGEASAALAEARADEEAAREALPPMTALAVTARRRYLLPVVLARGSWSAAAPERSWDAGAARYETAGRGLTIQLDIVLADGSWTGHYETARDPAGYSASVLARLAAEG